MMPNADAKELQEFFSQTRRGLQEWPENLADKGTWKVLPFVIPVYKMGKLCGKKTKFMQKRISDLFKKIPFDVISAGFSILSARKRNLYNIKAGAFCRTMFFGATLVFVFRPNAPWWLIQ